MEHHKRQLLIAVVTLKNDTVKLVKLSRLNISGNIDNLNYIS